MRDNEQIKLVTKCQPKILSSGGTNTKYQVHIFLNNCITENKFKLVFLA